MAVSESILVTVALRERSKVIAYIWSVVHNGHLAEDVFQEVFLLALQKRDSIEGAEQILPWMRTTARHCALKAMAKQSKAPALWDEKLLDELDAAWGEQDTSHSDDFADALERCLERLNAKARRIVELRYGECLRGEAMAAALGIEVRSVYQAVSRIHVTLRECIERRVGLAGEGGR